MVQQRANRAVCVERVNSWRSACCTSSSVRQSARPAPQLIPEQSVSLASRAADTFLFGLFIQCSTRYTRGHLSANSTINLLINLFFIGASLHYTTNLIFSITFLSTDSSYMSHIRSLPSIYKPLAVSRSLLVTFPTECDQRFTDN